MKKNHIDDAPKPIMKKNNHKDDITLVPKPIKAPGLNSVLTALPRSASFFLA
jgi:hypothetical protein